MPFFVFWLQAGVHSGGSTAVQQAIESNSAEALETLLTVGKVSANSKDQLGRRPLQIALETTPKPKVDMVEVLLRYKANAEPSSVALCVQQDSVACLEVSSCRQFWYFRSEYIFFKNIGLTFTVAVAVVTTRAQSRYDDSAHYRGHQPNVGEYCC